MRTLTGYRRHCSFWLLGGLLACGCQIDQGAWRFRNTVQEQRKEAVEQWDNVRSRVRVRLAQQHLEAGNLEEAEKEVERAIATAPNNAEAFLLAARLRLERGQLARAREAISIALTKSHGDPEIEYVAGLIAQRYGNLDAALEHYSAAARSAPHVATHLLAEAEMLVALGRPVDALALISPRIRDFEACIPMRMLAARINRMLGLRAPAIEHCREVLRKGEDDPTLCAEIGELLVWAGHYDDAIALLQPLFEPADMGGTLVRRPGDDSERVDSTSVIRDLAKAYLETGHTLEAQRMLRTIMSRNDGLALTACLYARAALMSGDLDAAQEALALAHEKASPTPESLLLEAYVAWKRGAHNDAVNAAEAALNLDGRLALAHCLIGQSAAATGQHERARRAYSDALTLDPGLAVARMLRDRLPAIPVRESDFSSRVLPNACASLGQVESTAGEVNDGPWQLRDGEILYRPGPSAILQVMVKP